MREITITSNDAGRRLDRFLRKYLPGASLGEIYKIIRKDVKVDSKRRSESYMLNEGETLTLYLSDETLEKFGAGAKNGFGARGGAASGNGAFGGSGAASGNGAFGGSVAAGKGKAKRNFGIVYEDANILIASKPFGLLTHGDRREKKDHLANQVKDHLIASGAYDPRSEKVFSPAPVNRLDRNTTGMVLFGKTAAAMRELTRMIREDEIRKFYLTIACGIIEDELRLSGSLIKDEESNKVSVRNDGGSAGHADAADAAGGSGHAAAADVAGGSGHTAAADVAGGSGHADASERSVGAKHIETIVRPLETLRFGDGLTATLCEIELVTGRSHQIRAHLASAGHPLIGDSKYAGSSERAGGSRAAGSSKRADGSKAGNSQRADTGKAAGRDKSRGGDPGRINRYVKDRFGLSTQLLHACKVEFKDSVLGSEELGYLAGRSFESPAPRRFAEILRGLQGK